MSSLSRLVLFVLLAILTTGALDAQSICSTRAMAGVWAAASEGTVLPNENNLPIVGPGAAVGLVSIGYDGQVSISLAGNVGGLVSPNAFLATGTIAVNPDCTGSLRADTANGWTLAEDFVVSDNGDEVRTIAVGPFYRTGKPVVWQCRWKRLAHVPLSPSGIVPSCSADMLRGTWVGSFDGAVLTGPATALPAGILTRSIIDHRSDLHGQFTASIGGAISKGTVEGAITEVNANCMGTRTYRFSGPDGLLPPGEVTETFVILDQGREIWSLPIQGTLGMPVGLVRYRLISPVSF